jgi:ribosomal-protein-alanine N-acetyltransferase
LIRPATSADAAPIAVVEAAAAHHPWSADAVAASLAAPSCRAWVATSGIDVVGHLLSTAAGGVADVLTIAVHPDAQRRGLGRALLAAAAAGWRDEAVAEAFLEVRADNEAAIALYRACGWRPAGRRRAYYADGADGLVLRLDLTG